MNFIARHRQIKVTLVLGLMYESDDSATYLSWSSTGDALFHPCKLINEHRGSGNAGEIAEHRLKCKKENKRK